MSIILYTPATGFPDLEVKIAYGLAMVGIEAGYEFKLIPEKGYYRVEFLTGEPNKLQSTFLTILRRILSSDRVFDLGVKAKDKGKYSATESVVSSLANINFQEIFSLKTVSNLNIKRDMFCGHEDIPRFGGRSGLILISSFHAGKPYERDKRFSTFNQSLCSVCGYLAVLGLYSFCFNIQLGRGKNKKYVMVLPIPEKEISTRDLNMLLSMQKTLHNFWLSENLPLRIFTIGLLAKVPSISYIVNELNLHFHLLFLSKDNRGDTVVEQTALINAIPFSKFISANSFNAAIIERLLGNHNELPKTSPLIEISSLLQHNTSQNLVKFARLYVQETSTKNYTNLLYPETAKYLLKEVAMIRPDIIENPALGSLARTLRYFIREKKYGYADDIRNARKESKDFEDTIAKMMREGRLRLEQKEKIHLPTDEEMKEIFRLANDDFDKTKTALIILAFSFPSKTEEGISETLEEATDEEND